MKMSSAEIIEIGYNSALLHQNQAAYDNREQEDACLGIPIEKCLDLL